MVRQLRNGKGVQLMSKTPEKPKQLAVVNVNKQAAIATQGQMSVKKGEIHDKSNTPVKRKSNTKLDSVITSPAGKKKRLKRGEASEDELKDVLSGSRSSQSPVPQIQVQQKYQTKNIPKITIRGNQAFIEGQTDPIPCDFVEAETDDGEKVLRLAIDVNDSFARSSDSESDNESSDEEGSESESSDEASEEGEIPDPQEKQASNIEVIANKKQQIGDIDREVAQRLHDLQTIMLEGDMQESMTTIEQMLNKTTKGKVKNKQ